jgi:hypothetical protein
VVGVGGQQQAVLAVEALAVVGVAPRLAVAGAQVLDAIHAGQPAGGLALHHVLLEQALAASGQYHCLARGLGQVQVGGDRRAM